MKMDQKWIKNGSINFYSILSVLKISFFYAYFFAVPLLLLIASCGKQSDVNTIVQTERTEARSLNEFCDHDNPPCLTQPINVVNQPHVINGCTFFVSYTYWVCGNEIIIRNMTYTIDNSAPCSNIKNVWNLFWQNGQSLQANESLNQLYRDLSNSIENVVMGLQPPGTYMSTSFVATGCHTVCAVEIKDEENPSFFALSHVQCGTSCCIRTSTWEYKDGQWVEIETPAVFAGGDCDPVPITGCEGETDPEICDPACARL